MPAQFDADLAKLKERLLKMGSLAERMIRSIGTTLIEHSTDMLPEVYRDEQEIDLLQLEVDEETVRMIGVYTPVAADLRLLLMVTRINAEIERIADKAVDIGYAYEDFLQGQRPKPIVDFRPAVEMAESMVRDSLNAFVEGSVEKALAVIERDDKVDKQVDQMTRALFTHMLDDSKVFGYVFGLVTAAQSLERIADHAVNICEDVVYIVKGKDIRHSDAGDEIK